MRIPDLIVNSAVGTHLFPVFIRIPDVPTALLTIKSGIRISRKMQKSPAFQAGDMLFYTDMPFITFRRRSDPTAPLRWERCHCAEERGESSPLPPRGIGASG